MMMMMINISDLSQLYYFWHFSELQTKFFDVHNYGPFACLLQTVL